MHNSRDIQMGRPTLNVFGVINEVQYFPSILLYLCSENMSCGWKDNLSKMLTVVYVSSHDSVGLYFLIYGQQAHFQKCLYKRENKHVRLPEPNIARQDNNYFLKQSSKSKGLFKALNKKGNVLFSQAIQLPLQRRSK